MHLAEMATLQEVKKIYYKHNIKYVSNKPQHPQHITSALSDTVDVSTHTNWLCVDHTWFCILWSDYWAILGSSRYLDGRLLIAGSNYEICALSVSVGMRA